jgi:hypothetical protein
MLTFRKIGYTAAIVAAGVLGATAASATVIDFTNTSVTEAGVPDGTNVSGVGVAGYGFNGTSVVKNSYVAYFDGPTGSASVPGGLGVCKVLSGTQCAPNSDDNLAAGEAVGLAFGTGTLNSISFRGAANGVGGSATHNVLADGSTFLWSLDGGTFTQGTVGAGGVWNNGGMGIDTSARGIFFATDAFEIYIASADFTGPGGNNNQPNPVPLPAGGLLLLTALAGLGAARKRAKKS